MTLIEHTFHNEPEFWNYVQKSLSTPPLNNTFFKKSEPVGDLSAFSVSFDLIWVDNHKAVLEMEKIVEYDLVTILSILSIWMA